MVDEIKDELLELDEVLDFYIPRPMMGHPFKMRVRPGVYSLDYPIREDRIPNPTPFSMDSDEVYVFQDDVSQKLRKEIRDFWELGPKHEETGLLHKRGIILHGPPGSGKTTFIKNECKSLRGRDQVVFISKSPYALRESMHVFRRMEPHRELTVIIEDIDELIKSWGQHSLLEMLDGSDSINHVLFIATTNDLDCLSAKLRRPGRFDRKIHVPNPNAKMREVYLSKKLEGKANHAQIKRMTELTEGMSFGHLRNLVVQTYGYGISLTEAVKEMRHDMLVESKSRKSRSKSPYKVLDYFEEDCSYE